MEWEGGRRGGDGEEEGGGIVQILEADTQIFIVDSISCE